MSMVFTFGKYKGKRISQIPPAYLSWALREVQDLAPQMRTAIAAELERRPTKPRGVPQPPPNLDERLAWLIERLDDAEGCVPADRKHSADVLSAIRQAAELLQAALESVRTGAPIQWPAEAPRHPATIPFPGSRKAKPARQTPEERQQDRHLRSIAGDARPFLYLPPEGA